MMLNNVKVTTEAFEVPDAPEGVELGGNIEIKHVFADPWCCLMCRTAGKICEFHTSMEADGYKPPKSFAGLL